jgi:uncharacterized membrane protein YciS (DUF1049 family)
MKIIRLILFLIGVVVIVDLAVANRHPVELSFWPLAYAVTLPLYALLLIVMALGVILGGVAAWLSRSAKRSETRRLQRRMRTVEEEDRRRQQAEEQALMEEARRKTAALALTPPRSSAVVPLRPEPFAAARV